ncbi:hypothetical protein [Marispirochaeta sp.]|uniref:hypothetical protein n=1 Tax=Marispirochaeta sp. TaxID=2038653 RepID=UPI0029C78BC0|nr:hypothetical protein [Marispirochaeta sp.]
MPMMIKRLLLVCLSLVTVFAAAQESALVKRSIAVVTEQDHPQLQILAQNMEAELFNIESINAAVNPGESDAVIYLGRLEFGSRASLWVRGVDRYTDAEVFTETHIFQNFDLEALLTDFLPRVITAVKTGFPPLDPETARIAAEGGRADIVFSEPEIDPRPEPVTLTLHVPPGTVLILKNGIRKNEKEGRIELRALPGAILPYRAEAPGHVSGEGELVIGSMDQHTTLDMVPFALWAVDLKARLWEFGASAGIIRFLLDEEIYLYASLEQNILSLKNVFTLWDDASRGFVQPLAGIGGYGLPPDYPVRPYMGFGVLTRFVFGDEGMYLSKTLTAGIDISMGLDVKLFKREDISIILDYTPRFFYSSFYDNPFEKYHAGEGLPVHLEGHWHLQWSGPVNLGVRWKL